LNTRSVAAILVWWTIVLGLVLSVWPRAGVPRAGVAAAGALTGFALLTATSMAWAPSAERAFAEANRVLLYLGVLVLVLLATRRGDAARWMDGLALGIASVALLALAQRLLPGLLPPDDLPAQLGAARSRLTYPLGYWNGLGILLGVGVPLLLHRAAAAGPPFARAAAVAALPPLAGALFLTSSRGGVLVAVLGAALFVALAPGGRRLAAVVAVAAGALGAAAAVAVLRSSPGVVDGLYGSPAAERDGPLLLAAVVAVSLAAAAVHLAASALLPARLHLPRAAWAGLGAVLAAALAVAAVASDPLERLRAFKAPPAAADGPDFIASHLLSRGGSGRWQFWSAAVEEWTANPIAGGGAGSFEPWWAQHGSLAYFIRNAHSLWLETLGELGLAGLVLLAGTFAAGLVAGAGRLRRAGGPEPMAVAGLLAALGAFLAGAALDWIWQLPAVALVGVACVGLLAGPATLPAGPAELTVARPHRPRHRPGMARFAAGVALVGFGWAVMAAESVPLLAGVEVSASQRAVARGDLAGAAGHASSAVAIQPWAASPRVQEALVAEVRGNLAAARGHVAAAIERDPEDWRLRLVAARLATKAGEIAEARRALSEARRLHPRSDLGGTSGRGGPSG
jgi:hypothetical protein